MTNKDLQYVISYQSNYPIHNTIYYYTEYIYEDYKILFKSKYTNNKLVEYSISYYNKSFSRISMSGCLMLSEMYDNVELYNYYDYADL